VKPSHVRDMLPAKVVASFQANGGSSSVAQGNVQGESALFHAPLVALQGQPRGNGAVVVNAGQRVAVPAFAGDALRKVIETASGLGLRVEPLGSGIAREQVPPAGTRVPLGTQVVVRFAR
ncbi:MAG: PASTA domain-containing protein, partial [Acidobacteriota bacterium]|nr:PASTA domain-containing protein [Acidobacteriota bacterium]